MLEQEDTQNQEDEERFIIFFPPPLPYSLKSLSRFRSLV